MNYHEIDRKRWGADHLEVGGFADDSIGEGLAETMKTHLLENNCVFPVNGKYLD